MGDLVDYPKGLFKPGRRHLVLLAHQDDELPNAGILSRLGPDTRIVWLTNGDGLAFREDMDPEEYGALRTQESITAVGHLGMDTSQLVFLGHSEIAIYRLLAEMSADPDGAVPQRFVEIAAQIVAATRDFAPDVIWTQAWQGGHPEHDLIHIFAALARQQVARAAPLFELPAYEFMILLPLRFRPWRKEPHFEVELTRSELEAKQSMFKSYPTQDFLLHDFQKLIGFYGKLATLRGSQFDFDDFARHEQFGLVPADRNYGVSTHMHEWFDYMFEDFEGVPIRFGATMPRIARLLGVNSRSDGD